MLPPRPLAVATHDLVLVRRDDDEDGDFHDVARTSVPACTVQPEAPSESYDTGQQARRTFRIRDRSRALIAARAQDALEADGELVGLPGQRVRLTLIGPPAVWEHHVEVAAAWVAG